MRLGENVNAATSWDMLDRVRLTTLLETSFGKQVVPDYFESAALHTAYVSDSYRAGAIICRGPDNLARLDKFAVTEAAQGEGIGGALWRRVRAAHPSMYWRARPGNPINPFYFRHADGFVRGRDWLVFWYGIDDLRSLDTLVSHTLALPETMLEHSADPESA